LIALVALAISATAQSRPTQPKPRATPVPAASPIDSSDKPTEPQEVETIKTDTDLVAVPVIATDRNGLYVPDLSKAEFGILEDGVKQDIAFFAQVSAPFHVVLMLDTSASTKDKLSAIQNAAYLFVQQLQPADQVKIISFDDEIRDLNEFTSD